MTKALLQLQLKVAKSNEALVRAVQGRVVTPLPKKLPHGDTSLQLAALHGNMNVFSREVRGTRYENTEALTMCTKVNAVLQLLKRIAAFAKDQANIHQEVKELKAGPRSIQAGSCCCCNEHERRNSCACTCGCGRKGRCSC
jgi:hypothetical protein